MDIQGFNYMGLVFFKYLIFFSFKVVIQPNKMFYESIAPPNSFIHAEDFDYDPIRLGKYLQLVSRNFELYSMYLKWKYEYEVVFSEKKVESRRLCELCSLLNQEKSSIHYESISKWFNSQCLVN
jgi:hypothetical protein